MNRRGLITLIQVLVAISVILAILIFGLISVCDGQEIEELDSLKRRVVVREALSEHIGGQIDVYLEGSPMAGLGPSMAEEGKRTGIDPRICAAVAAAESSLGRACFALHNAWGMLADGGYSSWEAGIIRWFDNCLNHWGQVSSAYQMPGYCVPDYPWMPNVEGQLNYIRGIIP